MNKLNDQLKGTREKKKIITLIIYEIKLKMKGKIKEKAKKKKTISRLLAW